MILTAECMLTLCMKCHQSMPHSCTGSWSASAEPSSQETVKSKSYRRRTLMIHGVNDWTHGKPAQLSAEQCVIDDVEQHCGNGPIQNLLQRQVGYLGVGKGCQHKGQDEPCSLLHRRPCTEASLSLIGRSRLLRPAENIQQMQSSNKRFIT